MHHVDIVHVVNGEQINLPLFWQAKEIIKKRENQRLVECWIGISPSDDLGSKFCNGCEYLDRCLDLYRLLADSRKMHPSTLARKVIKGFEIESDYI